MPHVLARFIVYFSKRSSYIDRVLSVLDEVIAEVGGSIEVIIQKVPLEDNPELVFSEGVVAVPAIDIVNAETHRFIGIPHKKDLLDILSLFPGFELSV